MSVQFETYPDLFRIHMKWRAMIAICTLKGQKARAMHTEPESAYGPETVALQAVEKWRRCFHHGRTDLFDDLRPEGF
jgi:hypothetical protein